MFQSEFRELISLLINCICAVAILAAVVFSIQLKNKIGVAASETYNTQRFMEMKYEFNAYDGTQITKDEAVAAFANYINSDISICLINPSGNATAKAGVVRNRQDYRLSPGDFTADKIKLNYFDNYATGKTKFNVYLSYDNEDPKTARDYYSINNNKPVKTRQIKPTYVSGITLVAE